MSMTKDTDTDGSIDTEHTQGDFAIGDVVADREADTDGDPVVVNLPPVACAEWDAYRTDDGAVTVAEDNPAYDAESEVVVVMYDEDLDGWGAEWDGDRPLPLAEAPHGATYAFPPGRLEHTGGTYGAGGDPDDDPDDEADSEEPDDATDDEGEEPADTLREDLDAIADVVAELNVDSVAVDTFREVVVVEKLGKQYAITRSGEVDADDPLADRLADALGEVSGE
jgi:hypothetical protein